MSVTYAWSMKRISYFMSTCGNTCQSERLYRSNFEDEFGSAAFKEISPLDISQFLYYYLPLIDEHNKHKQIAFNPKKCWPTKCFWFRICTTLLGTSITDFYRIYIFHDFERYEDMGAWGFSDKLCSGLKQRDRKVFPKAIQDSDFYGAAHLVRISNSQGKILKMISGTINWKFGYVSSGIQKTFCMCRFYHAGNKEKYKCTSYTFKWC